MSQTKAIDRMTDKEILLSLYSSQALMLAIALIIGLFMFSDWSEFFSLFTWDFREIVFFGGGVAVLVIVVDLILYKFLPTSWVDDGGINERVFKNRNIIHIFFIALVVAVSEEILFRGILQTGLGLVPASLIFAIIHFRYLSKIILFIMTVSISFLLGYAFWYTGNLLVPIFAHFLIDFILGVLLSKAKSRGDLHAEI
ncbi:CPBP family intramembrane glutamic endopeptidase [Bacillus alkalicellulosilyticus]|uniref:CPBP family intramembrane glutamic endopeptidase n=1 Tax=Alkalihalobacterium alkalicellulosilyticum TaxID=1912214 RepID=UPI000996D7D6|nr:CPBP family intramembrane glutamic endopeptidase [Bacillus alkalicellulosilyticus]